MTAPGSGGNGWGGILQGGGVVAWLWNAVPDPTGFGTGTEV